MVELKEAIKKKRAWRNTQVYSVPLVRITHVMSHTRIYVMSAEEQSIHQLDDGACITILVLLGPGRFEGDGGFAVGSPCRGACDCVPT